MSVRLGSIPADHACRTLIRKVLARAAPKLGSASALVRWQLTAIKPVTRRQVSTGTGHLYICSSTVRDRAGTVSPAVPDWPGLELWRNSEVDERRVWAEKGAISVVIMIEMSF